MGSNYYPEELVDVWCHKKKVQAGPQWCQSIPCLDQAAYERFIPGMDKLYCVDIANNVFCLRNTVQSITNDLVIEICEK